MNDFIVKCSTLDTNQPSLVISRLGSLGVYQKAVYFYCCVVNVSFVKKPGIKHVPHKRLEIMKL